MTLLPLQSLKIFFLFFLCVYGVEAEVFTEEEKAWIENNPIVKVGVEADWAPIDFAKEGKHKGISNEYLKLIAQTTGLKFDIEIDLWKNNLQKMKEQTIDLLPALYYTDERSTYMQYSKAYFEILDYFFIRDDINATSMDDLEGKVVAIPQGDARIDILKKNFPHLKILTVPSFNDAIDAVLEQKADILFDTYATVEYTLKKQSIRSIVPFKSHRLKGPMKLYMASHKDNPLLASIVSKSISAISHKEKKLIYDKWIHKGLHGEPSTQHTATRITLSKQENKWLKNHKTITFAGDPNWLPFEAFDDEGEYIGIVADYLHHIEKNVPLKFNPTKTQDWSETIAHAKIGDIDVISDDIDSAPLQKHYVPISAYIKSPIVIVMREGHVFVSDLDEIDNKKIVLIAEYGYNDKVKKIYPDISFIYEENADKAMLSLSLGKIDAILLTLPKAQYLLGVQGYNNINIVGKTKVTMGLTLFVRKDKPHLHSILQKTMKELVNTRHLDIFSKWQKVKFAEKIDYTFAYQVLGLFLLFVLGTWYWYRKLREEVEKRKASENQMSMMIDNIPLNLIVSGMDGGILRANSYALKTFDIAPEDIYDYSTLQFYANLSERDDIVSTIKNKGSVKKQIVKLKRLDDKEMDIMISVIPIVYDERNALLSIMVDLTERVLMEEDLRQAKIGADKANKTKSEFLAKMSHEIRTPMNAIMGFAELLNEQVETPRLKGYTKTIKNAGKTLLTLINDILDLSKIEAGKLDIHMSAVNVYDLTNDVCVMFSLKAATKDLSIIVEINDSVPKSLLIDGIRLRQILVNIIGNAIKFTEEGYVKIVVTAAEIYEHTSKINLCISIEDTGIGIEKNQKERIFNSFEQQRGQDNEKYEGTGLGLSITRRLLEMMDGKITVESEVGKGTTFFVNLYNVDISSVQVVNDNLNNDSDWKNIVFNRAKVLVVDDIEDNRELISKNFEDTAIEIITANDGVEAIAQFKKCNPDLILMDIRMPNMDGYEAASIIRSLGKVPIVALTASVMKDEYEQVKSRDFNGYLRKPVLRRDLFFKLSHFLECTIETQALECDNERFVLKLDVYTKRNIKVIIKELKEDVSILHKKASASNNMQQIGQFNTGLKSFADKHDIGVLKDYTQQLSEAMESFDVNQMKILLLEYSKLEKKFELI